MGYAILHLKKGKGSGSGLGNHIDRKVGKEHSYKNADPRRRDLNIKYTPNKYTKMDFSRAIDQRIQDGYRSNRKIRTDAVRYCNAILSGSHIEMKKMEKNEKKFNSWVQKNYDFMCENFGAENIVRFSLHLDEKTPHIHCCFVPITSEGKLSAKEVMGNKSNLQKLQDNYALAMVDFGLKRGLRSSGQRHETAQQYNARINNALDPSKDIKLINEAQGLVDMVVRKPKLKDRVNLDSYRDDIIEETKLFVTKTIELQAERYAPLESENSSLKREVAKLKGHLSELNRNYGEINRAEYSVKHDKDEIIFKRGDGAIKLDVSFINKSLSKSSYDKKVRQLLKNRQTEVANAHYQIAKEKNDLSIYTQEDLRLLAREIANKTYEYNDKQIHTVEGKQFELTIIAEKSKSGEMAYFGYYPEYDDERNEKLKQIGEALINPEELTSSIFTALFKEQQRVLVELHKKEKEEARKNRRDRGYSGGMSM